jgi:uncharacterized alkaline shock family protein YloU
MEETRLGRIEVSPTAIASLASQVVLECYGVVGMATKDLASGLVEILQPASHRRGVDVDPLVVVVVEIPVLDAHDLGPHRPSGVGQQGMV